jgi:hypothetical protein
MKITAKALEVRCQKQNVGSKILVDQGGVGRNGGDAGRTLHVNLGKAR